MSTQTTELCRAIRAARRGRQPRGWRYSAELQRAVIAYAMARRRDGRSLRAIAAELGLSNKRLHLWVASQRQRFRPVAVHAAVPTPAVSSLRLVTSEGHRVEGLTREDLVAILRALS